MRRKNYPHNVIRIRKGKKSLEQVYWIVAILNKKKSSSLDIVYKLGYLQYGKKGMLVFHFNKLAFFLNKGFIMNKSVKRLVALIANR